MDLRFVPKGIKLVQEAIAADNDKDYEKAYGLYKLSLDHFLMGLKYEKNPAAKEIIQKRVEGYMERAEMLKKVLQDQRDAPKKSAAEGGGGGSVDKDKAKLRGALAGAIVKEKPNVKWTDVAGLDGAKAALKEAVILPVKFPQLFVGKRRPWKGILLYGPPGTGKSFLAKAVATEADGTFFSVSSSDLVSKWQGESERLVRNLFEMAREAKPSIVFVDEVDSLCGSRDGGGGGGGSESARRIKTEFLVQMQGVGKSHDGILVLGATNTPWSLDPAIRRRFEKRIYISLPDEAARARMFKLHTGDTPNTLTDADFTRCGRKTAGFSGSDISVAVREALMEPLRKCQQAAEFYKHEDGFYSPVVPGKKPEAGTEKVAMTLFEVPDKMLRVPKVDGSDFMAVLDRCNSSVSPDELVHFEKWTQEFGQEG
jgi:vacuolar protein-sorting-associated protein 4